VTVPFVRLTCWLLVSLMGASLRSAKTEGAKHAWAVADVVGYTVAVFLASTVSWVFWWDLYISSEKLGLLERGIFQKVQTDYAAKIVAVSSSR
jgi:hypothetical protein